MSAPAFGFSVGRYLTETMEVDGQLLGFVGPARERSSRTTIGQDRPAMVLRREQRHSVMVMTRVNFFLGTARWRPYRPTRTRGSTVPTAAGDWQNVAARPPGETRRGPAARRDVAGANKPLRR